MSEIREFGLSEWTGGWTEFKNGKNPYGTDPDVLAKVTHVIEKSAYDEMKMQRDALVEVNAAVVQDFNELKYNCEAHSAIGDERINKLEQRIEKLRAGIEQFDTHNVYESRLRQLEALTEDDALANASLTERSGASDK